MGTVKGRPVNADTAYKIIIHTNGGHRYAATKQFSLSEEGKKTYTAQTLSRHLSLTTSH